METRGCINGQKMEAIKRLSAGVSIRKIAVGFGVRKATVGNWKQIKKEIEEYCSKVPQNALIKRVHLTNLIVML